MPALKSLLTAAALALAACAPVEAPPAPTPGPPPGMSGGMCGGIAGFACRAAGDYCAMPVGRCRTADASGTCQPRPQACTREYRPVCGCNGLTYGNACTAAFSIAYDGECKVG